MIDKERFLNAISHLKKSYIMISMGVLVVLITAGTIFVIKSQEQSSTVDTQAEQEVLKQTTLNESDLGKMEIVDSYENLGIVKVESYLNIRKEPKAGSDVLGKIYSDSACSILEDSGDGWYKIRSGEVEGYISSEFVLTGEEAKSVAFDLVSEYAVITTDRLNVRKEASMEAEVMGQVYHQERYKILSKEEGWVQINRGYLNMEYLEVHLGLDEAKKLDLKEMVFNLYENLGISSVSNYLNIREEPNEDGKIIGKMTSRSACDILEKTENGWYKIQSGPVTGYVKSDYILTGQPAKEEALKVAELMAIVTTDRLNARTEPSVEAKIWTQISNDERYSVINQMDGWVEIELEEGSNTFVSTDFVDVRYALPEAVKFSPLEEKINASSSLRNQIVDYALQFLGNPYVWGGTSLTKGADCSGFTLSIYKKFGQSLPHHSGAQIKLGKSVSTESVRPGDLVFYADSNGTVNHVGIYIGNGQIISAASKKTGIRISKLNYRKPVGIRNILGD